MIELYDEQHYEVFDPEEARVVALFFNKDDAVEYVNWRNQLRDR